MWGMIALEVVDLVGANIAAIVIRNRTLHRCFWFSDLFDIKSRAICEQRCLKAFFKSVFKF